MVDRLIGDAYPHVKSVADALDEIRYLASNMEAVITLAQLVVTLQAQVLVLETKVAVLELA